MSPNMSRVVPFLGAVALLIQAVPAAAQGWNNCCPTCAPAPCCPPPVTCMQPVSVPCYQTVPVTTYEPHRQIVMKPVVTTDYRDETITECRPVCETRTAQIPTCTYQPVTEFVPHTCDRGCWQTYCQCNPRCSPCQYDPSPGLLGWMNRTGYSIRMAMTPQVEYRRRWVPNYITTMVPRTHMVAQHSVREVAYNVTRMETHQVVHKVPVSRVVMVQDEITVQRPVTVFRTIPIGTSVAWVPFGSATATAALPGLSPDRVGRRKELHEIRAAERLGKKIGEKEGFEAGKRYEREKIERREDRFEDADPRRIDPQRSEVIPQRKPGESGGQQAVSMRLPSAVRMNGWMVRQRDTADEAQRAPVTVSVADAQK